jgi:hypothetical protein
MFKLLGFLLAGYALYAAVSGKVFAKAGPGSRVVSRDESPRYFWTVIAICAALSLALLTYF